MSGEILGVTPVQAGILFHEQQEPGSYVNHLDLELTGPLDIAAFAAAAERVCRRHETFRTSFHTDAADEPLAVVHDHAPELVHVHDADVDVAGLRAEPIDLARPGLSRIHIVPRGPQRTRILWTHHHLILDGWSVALVLGQIWQGYAALVDGREPPAIASPPLAEHIDQLAGRDAGAAREFWRDALAGATPTRLAVARPLPPGPGEPQRHLIATALDLDVGHRLAALAEREHVTPATIVSAAWALVLDRCTGSSDVVFGTTESGRDAPGLEHLVGMLVNTTPVRIRADPAASGAQLLQSVFAAAADRMPHAHLPLTGVAAAAGSAAAALFDTLVVIENFPVGQALDLPGGVQVARADAEEHTHYPLTVTVFPQPSWRVEIETLRADVGDAAAATVLRLLTGVLTELAADASRPCARLVPDLPVPPVEPVAAPAAGAAADVLELVRRQVEERPEAPAVRDATGTWSYRDLAAAAAAVAAGMGRPAAGLVALDLPRGRALWAAALGVLASGAAYVPLDPDWPAQRRRALLARIGDPPVLGTAALTRLLERAQRAPLPTADRPGAAPAYVVFTSGSTGRPKPVVVPRGALAAHATAIAAAYDLDAEDVVLQFTSPAFDVAAEEVFPTWARGALACCAPPARHETLADLVDFLDREGVTVANLPAALWAAWTEEVDRVPPPPSLRLVIVGNETVWPEQVRRWRRHTAVAVVNAYGTSETTITTTLHPVGDAPGAASVPVGRPLPGMGIDLLDHRDRPVPPGVVGEVVVGGSGIASGYLGDPGATAAAFVPDPQRPGRRRYRTGDRGYLHGSDLVLIGRTDEQVQIRGHRVEPGEVEALLRGLVGVREAVVLAPPGTPERPAHLAAHLVLDPPATVDAVRAALAETVPDHLVPARWIAHDRLPLLANGKVDRRALAAGDEPPAGAAAPASGIEHWLAQTWQDLLGAAAPREVPFLAAGGHSLAATALIGRIERAFGVRVPLRALLTASLAEQARLVDAARRAAAGRPGPPALTPTAGEPVLSFTQERLWFLDRLGGDPGAFNLPSAWRLHGSLDAAALRTALAGIVARHAALRCRFPAAGGLPTVVVRDRVPVDLPVTDLPDEDTAVAAALQAEARTPIDIEAGPLFRFRLLRLAPDEHVLLVTVHHIVFDGWSHGLLLRELSAGYAAALRGEPARCRPPAVDYLDIARWQRAWLSADVLAGQLDFWRAELAGAPTQLRLPLDRPRAAAAARAGERLRFTLPAHLGDGVRELARDFDTTVYVVLLAAFTSVLHRYCAQDDIVLGTPVAGRLDPASEPVIGCFFNTLPIRSRLAPGASFAEHVEALRARTYAALDHQETPFERIVEAVVQERDLDVDPLVQVFFLFQNTTPVPVDLPGLTARGLPIAEAVKSDLTLTMTDEAGAVEGLWEFDAAVLDRETIDVLGEALTAALDAAVADPDRAVAELPLLTPSRQRAVVAAGTGPDAGAAPGVAHRIAHWIATTPGAPAVVTDATTLTYADLGATRDRVRAALLAHGVGPGDTVAVLADPVPELLGCLLGIWAAGAAYTPFDPEQPLGRVRRIVDRAGISVLLRPRPGPAPWPEAGLTVVDSAEGPAAPATAGPDLPQAAAYVLFTSGSTGEPKGVVVPHRAVARHTESLVAACGHNPSTRGILLHRIGFDLSVPELFGFLAAGASLVLPDPSRREDPRHLAEQLRTHEVTAMWATPTMLGLLAQTGELGRADALTHILACGETLPGETARALRTQTRATIVNHYGPTETTVSITAGGLPPTHSATVPIGRPLPRCTARVVEPTGRLAVPGGIGELALGGDQLAHGYLAAPRLTAERFVPDPLGPPGSRRYLSGDLARLRPDGQLDHLGRKDRQLKVRGHRIEPAEVEAALTAQPGVDAALAALVGDRLLGFVTPAGADPEAVRRQVRAVLPRYLVPDRIVAVAGLPRTANAKRDLAALAALAATDRDLAGREPRPGTETEVAAILAEVLGRDRVGADDDFFAFGGQSILAMRAVARIEEAFGVELGVRALFAHPTVTDLAAHLEDQLIAAAPDDLLAALLDGEFATPAEPDEERAR